MEPQEIAGELQFIKQTMWASTRYTNVPPGGAVLAGVLGGAGAAASYWMLGAAKLADPGLLSRGDRIGLLVLWAGILAVAAGVSVALIVRQARKTGRSAWNPLVARMFFSELPLLLAGGLLTWVLADRGLDALIPGWWLLDYGLVLFGLHYYTGNDHRNQSLIFLTLGAVALFSPLGRAVMLLAAGFGAVHLLFGLKGFLEQSGEP